MSPGRKTNRLKIGNLFLIFGALLMFISFFKYAVAANDTVKYSDLEKQQISDQSQEALQEYYGDVLTTLGKPKFNNIATTENLAILNVTVNGKDTRILTRLRNGWMFPSQYNVSNFDLITTKNLIVLGNISLRGILYSDANTSFGLRRFYGIESANLRYTDEGISRLVNGKDNISVNPILGEVIEDYNIFLSPYGFTKGIYVSEKTNSYFVVKSVNPSSNIRFSWMLSGIRNNFKDEYLNSQGNKIKIIAEVNFENETTRVKFFGLFGNTQNQTTNQSSFANLLTGNFVLSTDLSAILQEAPNATSTNDASQQTSNITNQSALNDTTQLGSNSSSSSNIVNATSEIPSVLEFTIYSVNADDIINRTAFVSGLTAEQVKESISFVYKQPANFSDESIEEQSNFQSDWIKKVNGSVIITIG